MESFATRFGKESNGAAGESQAGGRWPPSASRTVSAFFVSLHLKGMVEGRVVPLLGAGVNLCGRPKDVQWAPDDPRYLPNGRELASYLATEFAFPETEATAPDLLRVSQYAKIMGGKDWLYDKLRELFTVDYEPTDLHRFLARLPQRLRDKGREPRYQLIVTTNYDDALERAFRDEEEPFDLVWYVAEGSEAGKFKHRSFDGAVKTITRPNKYLDVSTDERTVILKVHGAVDRADPKGDSYVIAENDYIEFLTRGTDVSTLVPIALAETLKDSEFLFLGYSLRDWNLRVILRRIWREQHREKASWAIQLRPDDLDQRFWGTEGVQIVDLDLDEYVRLLEEALERVPAAKVPA